MRNTTKLFIEEHIKDIENENWSFIHKDLINKSEPLVHINFIKSMLEAGINPGLPSSLKNYTLEDLKQDVFIISEMNYHDFTAPDIADENVWIYLNDPDIGKSLTNILRAIYYIRDDESILGNSEYEGNFRICIVGAYDKSVGTELDMEVQLETDKYEFLSTLELTDGPFNFNYKYYGEEWGEFYIEENTL